jgi:hypothetical protein
MDDLQPPKGSATAAVAGAIQRLADRSRSSSVARIGDEEPEALAPAFFLTGAFVGGCKPFESTKSPERAIRLREICPFPNSSCLP